MRYEKIISQDALKWKRFVYGQEIYMSRRVRYQWPRVSAAGRSNDVRGQDTLLGTQGLMPWNPTLRKMGTITK